MSSSDQQKYATNNTTTATATATTRSAAALRKKNVIVGPWDWTLLQEALHDAGWKVVVVVGYRRYAEWIMSVKQHAEKWTGRKPRHAQWPKTATAAASTSTSSTITKPHKNHQNNASSSTSDAGDGILFAPPFPTILTIRSGRDELWKPYYPFYDVNFILESLRQQLKQQINNNAMMMDVRILNLHEATTVQQATSSVRTTFLCHVLQNAAPHACRKSRAIDRRYVKAAAAAAASPASLNGTQETMQRRRANAAENAQSVMYDVLATTAAARGMVNIHRHSRRQVVKYCQEFHEKSLQNKVLPFHCPTREQLQSLLDLSLQKESEVFQKLVVDSSSSSLPSSL